MSKRPPLYWVPIAFIGLQSLWYYGGLAASAFMFSRSLTPEFLWTGLTSEPFRWGVIATILIILPIAFFGLLRSRSWGRWFALAALLFVATVFTLSTLLTETSTPKTYGHYIFAAVFILPNLLSAAILAVQK